MKRLLVMLTLMLFISGCADTDLIVPERNAAIDWRSDIYSPSMMISWAIKWEELPDVVEISDAAVIATVTELTHAELTREFHDLYFTYQLEIGEVLFDTTKMLSNGGSIAMSSGEGALTLAELKPRLDDTGSVYIPEYQGEHPDSDWVLATQHDATPIEVGRTYLLFLDRNPEDAVWIENGHEFIWEIADDRLIRGDGLSKWYEEAYTLEEVRAVIAARTGRCDEIGEAAYIAEVKAREAAELAAAKASLRERMDAAAASRTGAVIPMRKRQIVHTIENDLFAGDSLGERLAASEAVVIARMDAMTLAYGMDSLKIGYDMTVEAVLCDSADALAPGDTVSVQGLNGLFAAWEVQELVGFFEHNIKDGILQDGYTDGDYAAVRSCGAIPAEVGKSYLIFLDTSPILRDFDFFESGGAYFFEYADGRLYTGDGRKRRLADVRIADIENAISALG